MNTYSKETIAKVTKSFGATGELVLRLSETFSDDFSMEEPMFVDLDNLEVPLFFKAFRRNGPFKAIALFEDLDSDYRASELIGTDIYRLVVPQEEVFSDDMFYEDLVGYDFLDGRSSKRGKIVDFVDYADNPLFTVMFESLEVMVPITDKIITSVDENKQLVEAYLPDGLLELYSE